MVKEAKSFNEDIKDQWWQDVMDREMESIHQNDTWDLVKLLVGKRPIFGKWVYKLKQGPDHVDTCKTKLVYKGWWTTCWDRFWRNIFFHCEMGNIGNDFIFNYLVKWGIISLICENHFFEWRKFTWLNLKDFLLLVEKTKSVILKKLFTTWDKHHVLGTQR